MKLRSFSPDVVVNGEVIIEIISAFSQEDLAKKILAKHGIEEVDRGKYYSQQKYFDAFKELEGIIDPLMLTKMETKIVNSAKLEIADAIIGFFEKIDSSCKMNHRNDN